VLNPAAALLGLTNGEVADWYRRQRQRRSGGGGNDSNLVDVLASEAAAVARAAVPDVAAWRALPGWADFEHGPEYLLHRVLAVAEATGPNVSSMLADLRAGREPEVRFVNGYVWDVGRRLLGGSGGSDPAPTHAAVTRQLLRQHRLLTGGGRAQPSQLLPGMPDVGSELQ
jgi:ketopantoate reductase